jgi:hypothetical protein
VRVLDPACGSGNFLYVTLEHLKRLEGEVLDAMHRLGHGQTLLETSGITVDPHQLLGLEVNPRAATIAEMVLWIGYLQWHFRTRGNIRPPEPVIRNFRNIACRDAVLAWDRVESVSDTHGVPVTALSSQPSVACGGGRGSGRARVRGLCHVLVASGRRAHAGRTAAALRSHHHQQPAPDLQPPGDAAASEPPSV